MDIGSETDKRQSSSFIIYLGQWFRGRHTPENTIQRPSTSTTALPVRISSFGRGTPGNPIHRQKHQPLYSVDSRLSPLIRRVANESSPFGLGISYRTLLLPASFRPFFQRDRTTLPRPLFNATGFHGAHFVPPPSIVAAAHLPNPQYLLHPDVLPKSRLAPVSADPAETTADRLHAPDHTRSN